MVHQLATVVLKNRKNNVQRPKASARNASRQFWVNNGMTGCSTLQPHNSVISSVFGQQSNLGRIIWKKHLYNTSPELQNRVEVLKDILMYRVDKCRCILINDEIQSIIRFVCIEWVHRLLRSIVISLHFLLISSIIVCARVF